jgi:hypothetical protein
MLRDRMRHRHDHLTKRLLRRTLETDGAFTPEMEVSPDAQRFDGYFVPHKKRAARRRDLLDRLTVRPCAFEAFRGAPSARELEGCCRKLLNARHVVDLAKPRRPLPSVWILCAGNPQAGLAHISAVPKRGFMRGVYAASPVLHAGLVVLTQLPETRDTLILRLMGKGRTLRRALAELERLPEDARERQVALPVLLEYRGEVVESRTRTAEDEEFLMDTQDIVERLKDEGRAEGLAKGIAKGLAKGRHEDLLTIYRTRFGAVPRKVRAAIERTSDNAVLAKWVELFTARSAEEIAAAVGGR